MNNEYEILSHLEKNQYTSQRKIAKRTGLSVGTVNLLLKRMVRKGLVKIERLNAKTLRYIITPHGMAEKSRLVYQYIKTSYNQIIRINEALTLIVDENNVSGSQKRELIFFGQPDEVLEMLKIAAINLGLKYNVMSAEGELRDYIISCCPINGHNSDSFPGDGASDSPIIIIWTTGIADNLLEDINVNAINILDGI